MRKIMYLIAASVAVFVIVVVGDIEFYYMTGQSEKSAEKSTIQYNVQNLNLVNDCMKFQSLDSLVNCKESITNLKQECDSPSYAGAAICKDPRIDQFLNSADFKITSAQNQIDQVSEDMNDSISHLINLCSQSDTESCHETMSELKQECTTEKLGKINSCKDPRIEEIISKNINYSSANSDYFQDQVLSFIETCSKASGNDSIPTCATTARQMMNLCHSSTAPACNDDRLQQIANMGLNLAIVSEIDKTNDSIQTILDKCYNKTSDQTGCSDLKYTIRDSCTSNFKPYFPVCYDPRVQNFTK